MPNETETKWTPMQKAAISAHGASLVVSAAAGSGKTAVLVERIIRLLENEETGCKAENMIVATFTNDAAAEVRQRLNIALSKRAADEPDNAWLRRQLMLLPSMNVSTIHSFCIRLLRAQAASLHISSGFRVMETGEEDALKQSIISQVLEEMSAAAITDETVREEQQMLLEAFCTADDQPLERVLLELYEMTVLTPFGETLPDEAADACENGRAADAAAEEIAEKLAQAKGYYELALAYNQQADPEIKSVMTARGLLMDELALTEQLRELVLAHRFAEAADRLQAVKFGTLRQDKQPDEIRNTVKALRDRAKSLLTEKRHANALIHWAEPLQFAAQDLERQAKLLRICGRLLRRFTELLDAEKQSRNALSFSDALVLSLKLLAEKRPDGSIIRTPLAESLSQQYACLMIDEFQDADNLKEMIFRLLSHGGSQTQYGDNLFVVGDSKQCIYRFLNANPENFYRAMQEGAPYTGPELTANTRIDLSCNFRSGSEVIAFINHVFSSLMTERVGEVDYDDSQKLVQGAEYPEIEGGRPVELMVLEPEEDEPQAVAARIAWHLNRGTPVKTKEGEMQPCAPKDFLILLRTNTNMQRYADALKEAGIPVCAIGDSNCLQTPEITLLLEILRAIDNPLLEVSVASAMLSPMFGFSLNDLTAVRVYDRTSNLYQAMQKLCADEEADGALRGKCGSFLQFTEQMRLCSAMDTPEQLIRRIFRETDFLGLMQLRDSAGQKKANLRALLQYAHSYEENVGGGLSALLRSLDTMLSRGSKLEGGSIPAASVNAVSLKTIHGSKGLEAPFVIVAELNHRFSVKEEAKVCRQHADVGIGLRLYDSASLSFSKTLPWMTISARAKREALSEEMRLLYVALTRAREHLILPLTADSSMRKHAADYAFEQAVFGGQTDLLTSAAGRMSDWILMALIRNPSCEQLRRLLDAECGSDAEQPFLDVYIHGGDAEPAQTESGTKAAAETPADPALLSAMQTACAWHYESRLAGLTAKYGVSELSHHEDFSAPLRRPLFVRERRGLSGTERGTAVHTFLQYADFDRAKEDLSAETDRLRNAGRLTEKQADAVSRSKIADFFASDLCSRILRAKKVWREQKFTVRLSDLTLTGSLAELGEQYAGTEGMLIGIMDLVFEEADGIVLVDYKTDAVKSGSELTERYTEQVRLYAEALRLLHGKPVKACCLYSVQLSETVPVTL